MPAKPGSTARTARSSPRYQRARAAVLTEARHHNLPCALCHQPIDYDIAWNQKKPDPGYPTVNHIIPIDHGGDPYDPGNMEPAHLGCNSAHGNGVKTTAEPSRAW